MPLTRPRLGQLQTAVTKFDDPIIEINSALTGANTGDIGIIFNRGSSGDNVGLMWDKSAQQFAMMQTTADGSATGEITFSALADLQVKTLSTETFAFPIGDGTNGQVLTTDGLGAVTWETSGAAAVTYEALDANADVGTGAGQLAIGNHTHTGVYEPQNGNIQAHITDADQHRLINDAGTLTTDLLSANKILALDALKLSLTGGTLTGDLLFVDNDHILLGTGSDLDIFHNGGNSVIKNITGGLFIESAASTIAAFTQTSSKLYFSSNQKLETVTDGVDITGDVTVSTAAPTAADQLTRKDYVDTEIAAAASNMVVDNYAGGVDYTSGTSTALTLSQSPASENNITVTFDGVAQHHSEYSLAGAVVTFTSAIPLGTTDVEIISGSSLPIGTPSDGTVTEAKLDSAVQTKLNKDEVIYDSGVLVSDVDFIDITGLNLDGAESYDILFTLYNAQTGVVGFTMFPNGLTAHAYRTQITEMATTSVSTNKAVSPRIGFAGTGGNAAGHGKIYIADAGGDNAFYWTTDMITFVSGDIEHAQYAGFKDDLLYAPLTSLRIGATVSDAIKAGSRFQIVRKIS